MIVKNIKFPVVYQETEDLSYQNFCSAMFEIQKQIRTIKNRVSNDFYVEQMRRLQHKEETGEWDKFSTTQFSNEMYHKYKYLISMFNTGNYNQIIYSEIPILMSHWPDVLKGERAIDSFKKNQEINFKASCIKIHSEQGRYYITIAVFSNQGKKQLQISDGHITMKVLSTNIGITNILKRCVNGEYSVCASAIQYENNKKQWVFSLTYKFEKTVLDSSLDKSRILGIDLGIANAYYAATNFSQERFYEVGGDIEEFRKKIESKRWKLKKQRANCGSGSVGHGYNTRMRPVLNIGDQIKEFRKHKNNLMSHKIINEAVRLRCGTIQIEDLSGISVDNKFLHNWSYYDLQSMIKNKAAEVGIDVVMVNPRYTSQRCSKCGYIHHENRTTQSKFKCISCGYETHADYNAARNIATENIDKIIQKEISANHKQTKKSA